MIQIRESNNSDTVVQANTLVESKHTNLNKNEILVFKKIVSMIDTKYRTPQLQIPKRDLINFLFPKLKNKTNIDSSYYKKIKNYCNKLMKTTLDFHYLGERDSKYLTYSILIKFEWPYNEKNLFLKFSPEILPFLFEMKKSFTQYPVGILQKLNSKNSIRMYEYCRMKLHNQKEEYKWVVPLIEFKRIMDLEDSYPRFNNFNNWVLAKCIQEINKKTNINIKCETVMKSGSVTELIFIVKEKYLKTQKEVDTNKKIWNYINSNNR